MLSGQLSLFNPKFCPYTQGHYRHENGITWEVQNGMRYGVYNCHTMSCHFLLAARNKCEIYICLKAVHTEIYLSNSALYFSLQGTKFSDLQFCLKKHLNCHSLSTQSWTKSNLGGQMLWENIRVFLIYSKGWWQKQQKPQYVKYILQSESTWISHWVDCFIIITCSQEGKVSFSL
jgi:hypothetical protein